MLCTYRMCNASISKFALAVTEILLLLFCNDLSLYFSPLVTIRTFLVFRFDKNVHLVVFSGVLSLHLHLLIMYVYKRKSSASMCCFFLLCALYCVYVF